MDPGYQCVTRYVREAATYLHPEGRVLLGFSTTLGDHEALSQIAVSAGYSLREPAETVDDEGESLELIELQRDSSFAP